MRRGYSLKQMGKIGEHLFTEETPVYSTLNHEKNDELKVEFYTGSVTVNM
jgi:hypothetical protein